MFKTKRKRAVVLALIAFFCTAATTYVAVDWKRLGGGFLAYFKGKGSQTVASGGGSQSGTRVARLPASADSHSGAATLPRLATADMSRHGSTGGGSGGHKSDEDLFKYGDPAAGGIPPGSFIVAQNDTPGGHTNNGGAPAPEIGGAPAAPEGAAPAPAGGGDEGGGAGGGGVGSPAPSPAGSNGGSGDSGIVVGKTPTPAPPAATPPAATPPAATPPAATPPAATPPAATPPAPTPPVASPPADTPAPAPSQSGTTSDPGTGDGDPTGGSTTPISSPPPVSAVPEASDLAMMSLGALFLAVAATRKRKNG